MGVASLVLGIISVVVALFFSAGGWLAAILGIVGIILGAQARKSAEKQGIATAGLVLSIVGTALGIIGYIACAACIGGISSLM